MRKIIYQYSSADAYTATLTVFARHLPTGYSVNRTLPQPQCKCSSSCLNMVVVAVLGMCAVSHTSYGDLCSSHTAAMHLCLNTR